MIYLHIGWARAGSSTIQRFLETNAAVLRDHGVVTIDARTANQFARAIRTPGVSEDHPALVSFRQKIASAGHVLMSSEGLSRAFAAPDGLRVLRRSLAGHDVCVQLYVRNFTAWLPSLYSRHTSMGRNTFDFDTYLQRKSGIANAKPEVLSAWIDAFGRDALRVREMPSGDALVQDYAAACGLAGIPAINMMRGEVLNSSEHWVAVETARFVASHLSAPLDRQTFVETVRGLVRRMQPGGSARAQYVTPEQWAWLNDCYANRVKAINSALGEAAVKPADGKPPPPRPFLPTFEAIPREVRARLAVAIEADHLPANMPSVPAAVWRALRG